MKWMKYTVHTTEEAEDLVSGALYDLGIDSVEITDKRPPSAEEQAGLFGDVVPDMHQKGVEAEKYIRDAQKTLASILKVSEKEIYFTSGGTESNNWALIGAASANRHSGMIDLASMT